MDSLGRLLAIIVAIILIILLPLQYVSMSQGETIDNIVNARMTEFTDTARHQGYISLEMYENFVNILDSTGELYDIELEAAHPVSGKEVTEASLGDKMPDLTLKTVSYSPKEESENNVKSSFGGEINSFSTHTHTDACYVGHRHNVNCKIIGDMSKLVYVRFYRQSVYTGNSYDFVIRCASCDNVIFSFTGTWWGAQYLDTLKPNSIVKYYNYNQSGNVIENMYRYTTTSPGYDNLTIYAHNQNLNTICESLYWYCRSLPVSIQTEMSNCTVYTSQNIKWSRAFSYVDVSPDILTVPYIGCPYCGVYGQNFSCGFTQDENPICNQVVTSITATNPIQTVDKNGTMITTATATYLDGHIDTVNCASNLNSNVEGTQTVTLTYSGLVGSAKTTGTRTCTVDVMVKVPYKLTGLTVTPEIQNVNRYTNPVFTVTAVYDDGTYKDVSGFTVSNFDNHILGTQIVTITYSENGITKGADVSVTVINMSITCPVCGTVYQLDEQDTDNGCPNCKVTVVGIEADQSYVTVPQGEALPISVNALYADGSMGVILGWNSNYNASLLGRQEVTISYLGFTDNITVDVLVAKTVCSICNREYDLIEGVNEGCPYCKTEVVSISASPENVTIEKYSTLPITVVATFKDEHTEIVTDWSVDLVADTAGTFDVSVFYQSAVDHVLVTVLDDSLVLCPYCGLAYVFSESPEGCPVCHFTIVEIRATLRNGGTQVPYRSNLNIELEATYQDTHSEIILDGWSITGYQSDVLGVQTVTVQYKGFYTTLTIEVVNNPFVVICPNGHEYYLNEDGTDPGCPVCAQGTDSEDAVYYFDTTYTSDIIESLYNNGIFHLQLGDYLTVRITVRETSLRSRVQNLFHGDDAEEKKQSYLYGGEVMTL